MSCPYYNIRQCHPYRTKSVLNKPKTNLLESLSSIILESIDLSKALAKKITELQKVNTTQEQRIKELELELELLRSSS